MGEIEIERINSYDDPRFSEKILLQHGAYTVNGNLLYEIEIIGQDSAIVHGENQEYTENVIEAFRFYTEHICKFYDEDKRLIKEYAGMRTFPVQLRDIQPSQFYVDSAKKRAVSSFIECEDDIIIPLIQYENRYISLDGHTRMAAAIDKGFSWVKGFITQDNEYIYGFINEAKKRNIVSPYDMIELPHEEYEMKWNKFCENYFSEEDS